MYCALNLNMYIVSRKVFIHGLGLVKGIGGIVHILYLARS